MSPGTGLATAAEYLHAGLSVIPARVDEKRPTLLKWDDYQQRLPSATEVQRWFANGAAFYVVAGAVSGNLEMVDFDFKAELWPSWCELVDMEAPGLRDRLVIERSQSGGRHAVYRCEATIPGNQKLAQRIIPTPNGDEIDIGGKKFKPRKVENSY